jgi:GT2 family glycosyltransferase
LARKVLQQASDVTVSPIYCHFDSLDEAVLRGWAFDRNDPNAPALVHVIVDEQEIGIMRCDGRRPDVRTSGMGPEIVGFELGLPPALLGSGSHSLELRDRWRRVVVMHVNDEPKTSVTFTINPKIESFVDGLRQGTFEGWVLRKANPGAPFEGDVMVQITCDGVVIGHVRANRYRGDVSRALSAPPNCGFQFVPPANVRRGYPRDFRFFAMPEHIELANSPQHTTVVSDVEEARLLALVDSIDSLHRELTRVRREVREMLPRPGYTLATYDAWYRRYAEALRRRYLETKPPGAPLVSVICPVFRPDLAEFEAAVESVRAQTYTNWELILTDDNSRDKALTARINRFAAEDSRIRAVPRHKNGKISAATNTALEAARGEWVAFFDHDDLLVDVALSCMLDAARDSTKTVLYSDEDKIDASGIFSDPAMKPDWNHRLMLGVNYVCHLLMVRRDVLDRVRPLRSTYDGAQDHDLILRLSETVPESEIFHVPEILYHWRITANSTASGISAKTYAIDAGVKAVGDHLARLGRSANVSAVNGMSLYDVRFTLKKKPQVTIVIPFKDQIETTQCCIDALETRTAYGNWDVVLVDNWSTSPESAKFAAAIRRKKNMRLLRVEEPFNYSRLNNLAVKITDAEYVVFMNNDLFVSNEDWLTAVLGEVESDPKVGAVGGRFSYPNGTTQHAGVVLGIGGIAGHSHVGLQHDDGGYAGRALFAQEVSALTAAGMLVRRSAFHEVGGFDETDLQVAFNDVDLCLKLRRAGYRIIYTPAFRAEHHESLSRGDDERAMQEARLFQETEVMRARWGETLLRDPFYSRHFSLDKQVFFDLVEPG